MEGALLKSSLAQGTRPRFVAYLINVATFTPPFCEHSNQWWHWFLLHRINLFDCTVTLPSVFLLPIHSFISAGFWPVQNSLWAGSVVAFGGDGRDWLGDWGRSISQPFWGQERNPLKILFWLPIVLLILLPLFSLLTILIRYIFRLAGCICIIMVVVLEGVQALRSR